MVVHLELMGKAFPKCWVNTTRKMKKQKKLITVVKKTKYCEIERTFKVFHDAAMFLTSSDYICILEPVCLKETWGHLQLRFTQNVCFSNRNQSI